MNIACFLSLLIVSQFTFGSEDHPTPQNHNLPQPSAQAQVFVCQQDRMIEKPEGPEVLASLQAGLQDNKVQIVLPACLVRRVSHNSLPCEISRKRSREEGSDNQGAQ